MSSKRYREKLKKNDPLKYQEMLEKARERSKLNREARKMKWASEPQTCGLLQEIEIFKEKERKRWREYYSRKKAEDKPSTRRKSRTSLQAEVANKTPSKRNMDPAERREHRRKVQQLWRQRETPKKTWWRRKKDRERKQEKQAEKRKGSAISSNPPPEVCSPVKKAEYNLLAKIRHKLSNKKPSKFARLLKNLASNRLSEEQAHAVKRAGILLNKHDSQSMLNRKIAAARKRFKVQAKRPRKERRDALSQENKDLIKSFYMREDVSRALPSKRYATKKGPGYVMQQTLKQAHNLFKAENPSIKVGYTCFTKLKPGNVHKICATFLDTCQCVYCINIRLKVMAINRAITRHALDTSLKLEDERSVVEMLLCKKGDAPFHKPQCIQGVCQQCGCQELTLQRHYQLLLDANPTISWSKWDRGAAGREPVVKTGPAKELVEELVADIVAPSRNGSFAKHLFTAHWQHYEYRQLKEKLTVGQVLVVMDFAENKNSASQDEIKSAHFNKTQFSFHPVVAFYRSPDGDLVRHALDFVSDDVLHDCNSVHHFTTRTICYFKEQGILQPGCQLFIFSDNCAAQYKNKGTFADLSLYTESVQRLYYGAEHGKGEADGETGVVSKAIETAVLCRQVQIRGAEDFFTWCKDNLTKEAPKSKRHFEYVKSEDIKRDRPETAVKTITGCSKFHQVVRVAPLIIKSRGLACFCSACWDGLFDKCTNLAYVGQFEEHQIQPLRVETERSQPDSPEPPEPEPEPSLRREEFFAHLQQELIRHKRNFGSFVATAQDGLRRAESYSLPSPTIEPEFEKDEVDEAAERQRPAGAAPPDHRARKTLADGNCLARSLSAAVFGSDDYHTEVRVRLAMELAIRWPNYLRAELGQDLLAFLHASGDFSVVPTLELAFQCEVVTAVSNSKDMGLWHLMAAANVLGREVHSIFPTQNPFMTKVCKPEKPTSAAPVYIQWTSTHNTPLDAMWTANHVVPVVKTRHFVPQRGIQVGDFVMADFVSVDGKIGRYRAVVIPKPPHFPNCPGEVYVKCLRLSANGRYYVFPNVDDVSCVKMEQITKSHQPTMNNRGHYFF